MLLNKLIDDDYNIFFFAGRNLIEKKRISKKDKLAVFVEPSKIEEFNEILNKYMTTYSEIRIIKEKLKGLSIWKK